MIMLSKVEIAVGEYDFPHAMRLDTMLTHMHSCFRSGAYSDLTIRCGDGREFKVHKDIVCPQSQFFAKAVEEGRFKVSHFLRFELLYTTANFAGSRIKADVT